VSSICIHRKKNFQKQKSKKITTRGTPREEGLLKGFGQVKKVALFRNLRVLSNNSGPPKMNLPGALPEIVLPR
jgi:hypothetical protein